MEPSTIAAIATPPGAGGIGILKISGPEAVKIAGAVFRNRSKPTPPVTGKPAGPPAPAEHFFRSHHLYYGHIVDPVTRKNIDEVLLTVMHGPKSYTREDVIEIQAHSGPAVLRAIFDLVLRQGARIAEPGEFTKRAFLNGRIDLTQAEAVIDIINARTDAALQAATSQVDGKLKSVVEKIKKELSDLLVSIEASIDFPEDVEDILPTPKVIPKVQRCVVKAIEDLIQRYQTEHVYRDGLNLVIIGRPNVGKSSLMNCLVQKDRAIVTATPGTTRDLVEEGLQINGIPINIIDTAGLHDTDDPIETIGIRKAEQRIASANLVLLVIDAGDPLIADDVQIYKKHQEKNMILVVNKMDLVEDTDAFRIEVPKNWNGIAQARLSALYGEGIGTLKELIVKNVTGDIGRIADHSIIPNLRHENALKKCRDAVHRVVDGLQDNRPVELIAIDTKEAVDWLDSIIGTKSSADVLDQIFSQFCIGK
jgi:tRNA modification GTPase